LLYELESRLTLAELEQKSRAATRAHLDALEKDARESGFVLLANKARDARVTHLLAQLS
jgi:isopenicillin N synthase-like dioxygenase